MAHRWTPKDIKAAAVARVVAGDDVSEIARDAGVKFQTVYRWVKHAGAVAPAEDCVNVGRGVRLSFADRLEIQHGCSQGRSARQIATLLGRHHSVITREIARNGLTVPGEDGQVSVLYNARNAHAAAQARALRPKVRKLDTNQVLRGVVVGCLARRWSPGRISAWLVHSFADDETMRISHEANCSALYIQGKGSLRAELEAAHKPISFAKYCAALRRMSRSS